MWKIFIKTNLPFWSTTVSQIKGFSSARWGSRKTKQWHSARWGSRKTKQWHTRLEPKTKLRYKEKIDLISICDPFTIKEDEIITGIENFPNISYPDIVNYFMFALSPLTKEELKAYKELESYNQFVSWWVKELLIKEFSNGRVLVTGQVSIMYLAITSLNFWVQCLIL